MKTLQLISFLLLAVSCLPLSGTSQGCCSGGVPIANNIGLAPAAEKTLQLQLLYDLNVLNTLKERNNKLNDRSRTRKTHSFLLQSGYSFTEKISAEVVFTWIRQQRIINQFGNESETNTQGLGDAVLLVKYNLVNNQSITWQLGLGTKVPLGAFDKTNENGLTLNADLQPGTGSFDGIIFSQIHQRMPNSSRLFFSSITFAFKGTNRQYLQDQSYQTGHEFLLTSGLSDQFPLGTTLLNVSLSAQYRMAGTDQFNASKVPGTGGHWIFLRPATGLRVNSNISWNIMGYLPIYSYVNETQVTPSYRINTGIYFLLNQKKNKA